MLVQLMSDIHFEWHKDGGKSFINMLYTDEVDVLIVAGDIISAKNPDPLYRLADKYKRVLYVCGNHEFYGSSVNKTLDRLRALSHSNLTFLDNDLVEIDGKRFLGSTLWFNKDFVKRSGAREEWLNDFVSIHGFDYWVYKEHERAAKWLKDTIKEGDIVITHHLPSMDCVAPKWRTSPYNCFFASNQNDTIHQNKPAYWFFGHTHESVEIVIGQSKMVCNPFGYAGYEENHNFDYYKVFQI